MYVMEIVANPVNIGVPEITKNYERWTYDAGQDFVGLVSKVDTFPMQSI